MREQRNIMDVAILFVASIIFLYCASKSAFIAYASTWPTTEGLVLSKDIEDPRTGLEIEYSARGKTYKSRNVNFLGYIPSNRSWDQLIAYRVGEPTQVHFHPAWPDLAVAEVEQPAYGIIAMVIFGFMILSRWDMVAYFAGMLSARGNRNPILASRPQHPG